MLRQKFMMARNWDCVRRISSTRAYSDDVDVITMVTDYLMAQNPDDLVLLMDFHNWFRLKIIGINANDPYKFKTVLRLKCPDSVLFKRLSKRRRTKSCG